MGAWHLGSQLWLRRPANSSEGSALRQVGPQCGGTRVPVCISLHRLLALLASLGTARQRDHPKISLQLPLFDPNAKRLIVSYTRSSRVLLLSNSRLRVVEVVSCGDFAWGLRFD